MTEILVDHLRAWADEAKTVGWASDKILAQDCNEAADEIERLRERLEMTYGYDGDGNKVPLLAGGPDGIECRDETIRLQEAATKRGCEINAGLRQEIKRLLGAMERIKQFSAGPARGHPEGMVTLLAKIQLEARAALGSPIRDSGNDDE